MSSKDYKRAVLDGLLKKYINRSAKKIQTNRRILLKPAEVYKNYSRNNAKITEKQCLNEAVSGLLRMGFVTVDYLKFSDDIEKIYLQEENLDAVYEYLHREYGVIPQSIVSKQIRETVKQYDAAGEIVRSCCGGILAQLEDPRLSISPERIEANLKMIDFLEKNEEKLYVREASMLVYGDSKWFESNNYEEICTLLRNAAGRPRKESERNDAILEAFHVIPAEQEIFLKGDWRIEWEGYVLETARLQGGIAIASGDIPGIRRITVNASGVMTVENKTSYQRMKCGDNALMYLGGFANRCQIQFLKKVIQDNPGVNYLHFGDIDVGGFLIHKHLCRETGKDFSLYCMGVQQLKDERYRDCLKELTEHDRSRLETLLGEAPYCEVLKYMKEHNVKLEQEIISYHNQHS